MLSTNALYDGLVSDSEGRAGGWSTRVGGCLQRTTDGGPMPRPEKLELLPQEQALLEQIVFGPPFDAPREENIRRSCDAAAKLAAALISRKAIPEVRLRWFNDPDLQVRTKMSRAQIFVKNAGVDGVLNHPHFLPYLKYFIFGPDLPADVMDQFSAKVESLPFVSGSTYGELIDIARVATRRYRLSPHSACEEFWKLALECGVDDMYARMIRDAVLEVRTR